MEQFSKIKKLTERKMCVSIFSTTSFWNILRITERDMIQTVYWSASKVTVIIVTFHLDLNFLDSFSKNCQIWSSWKSTQWEPSCSMRKARWADMTKLIVAFCSFTKRLRWLSCLTKNKSVSIIKSSRLVTKKEKIGILCQTAQNTKHAGVTRQTF